MASINQLVSEIVHSLQLENSIPLRNSMRLSVIHARNELIRKSYNNHNYVDKILLQRFKLELINVPDGDLFGTEDLDLEKVKRTKNKVPKPLRFPNNLPFQSVRTTGYKTNVSIAHTKEGTSQFYSNLIGFCGKPTYDYINGYIYLFNTSGQFNNIKNIILESAFEIPHLIETETIERIEMKDEEDIYDDEFLLPEDLINSVKKMVLETFNPRAYKNDNNEEVQQ